MNFRYLSTEENLGNEKFDTLGRERGRDFLSQYLEHNRKEDRQNYENEGRIYDQPNCSALAVLVSNFNH